MKTNDKGYFCDIPCGLLNSDCQNFFCAGCATAGMRLKPNTEYPDVRLVKKKDTKVSEIRLK